MLSLTTEVAFSAIEMLDRLAIVTSGYKGERYPPCKRIDRHDYIPLKLDYFVSLLVLAYRATETIKKNQWESSSFLDVGCGTGCKLALASYFFMVAGIEYNKTLAKIARSMHDEIHHMDALKFKKYGEFDVVYFYRPFYDDEKQKKLESRIYEGMKPLAIVMPVARGASPPKEEFTQLYHDIFIKGKDTAKITKIRKALKKECQDLKYNGWADWKFRPCT